MNSTEVNQNNFERAETIPTNTNKQDLFGPIKFNSPGYNKGASLIEPVALLADPNNPNRIFRRQSTAGLKQNIDAKNTFNRSGLYYNREQLLTDNVAHELNTYLNFGVFPTFADTYIPNYKKGENPNDDYVLTNSDVGTPGVRSIFNRAGAVIIGTNSIDNARYDIDITNGDLNNTSFWRIGHNVPLMDSPDARRRIKNTSGCSIRELVIASENGLMGQETYAYSDFMYCKHLGKVSNNYLVTLRRFPVPVDDYIGTNGETFYQRRNRASKKAASIGCMVTWIGVSGNTMANILKYSYKMPFKEEEAEFQTKQADADQNQTLLNGMFSIFDSEYREQYMSGYSGEAANHVFQQFGLPVGSPPYKNLAGFRDEKTKVYGPIDSVRSTYVRADKGFTFNHRITLTFEYELRSYNGINGKQAMLDLISNILNVTYSTGVFWGGGFKGFGAHQSNVFANLEIFKCKGGFTDFVDAFSRDLSNAKSKLPDLGIDLANPASWLSFLKGLLNSVGGMLLGGLLNKLGRPQKAMYNALLSPAPIGFWHVTVGNPKKPIMSIGNMVITNTTIEHSGPLGLDDFPTGLKVTVELDRGKPRDLRDIEKLYMQGTDRIYAPMTDKVFDMYANSDEYKAHKKAGTLSEYTPIESNAGVNYEVGYQIVSENEASKDKNKKGQTNKVQKVKPKITPNVANASASLKSTLLKYFGTDDVYAIYVPATEQEYGSGKDPAKAEAEAKAKKDADDAAIAAYIAKRDGLALELLGNAIDPALTHVYDEDLKREVTVFKDSNSKKYVTNGEVVNEITMALVTRGYSYKESYDVVTKKFSEVFDGFYNFDNISIKQDVEFHNKAIKNPERYA